MARFMRLEVTNTLLDIGLIPLFYNSDVDGINVLYRRHSGDYGLLQPELA